MGLDYYGVLGITRQANVDDIQRAYRRLALKYHPFRSKESGEFFYKVAEAYDVLSCPKTKSLYDQYGEETIKLGVPVPPGPKEKIGPSEKYVFHGDPHKVFREFFGVDNPFAELKLPNVDPEYKYCPVPEEEKVQGENCTVPFRVTLEEAFRGCRKKITLIQKVLDEVQRKTVEREKIYKFQVPRGCTDKRRFVFKGAGNQGRNIIPGDVIFVARLMPCETFILEGKNFVVKKSIPLGHALTGCVLDVKTMDGKLLHVPLTGTVKPGQRICVPGEGMTIENTEKRGDLLVELEVEFPDRFNHSQKELLKAALLSKQSLPQVRCQQ